MKTFQPRSIVNYITCRSVNKFTFGLNILVFLPSIWIICLAFIASSLQKRSNYFSPKLKIKKYPKPHFQMSTAKTISTNFFSFQKRKSQICKKSLPCPLIKKINKPFVKGPRANRDFDFVRGHFSCTFSQYFSRTHAANDHCREIKARRKGSTDTLRPSPCCPILNFDPAAESRQVLRGGRGAIFAMGKPQRTSRATELRAELLETEALWPTHNFNCCRTTRARMRAAALVPRDWRISDRNWYRGLGYAIILSTTRAFAIGGVYLGLSCARNYISKLKRLQSGSKLNFNFCNFENWFSYLQNSLNCI